MGRLVDIEDVKAFINGLDYLPWEEELYDLLKTIPTAYDVEKVVEGIEEFYEEAEHYGFASALSDVVELVKCGGVRNE